MTTPILLSRKGLSPRKVVGTVDTSEFAIAVSATAGFLISLGWEDVNWLWVFSLMAGGIIAAPIAAWLVQKFHPQLMGVLVGGFIILVNARTLISEWITNTAVHPLIYTAIGVIWLSAVLFVLSKIGNRNIVKTAVDVHLKEK